MERHKTNCLSYAYFRLGLQSLERYIEPTYPISHFKELETVDDLDQAEAIGLICKKELIGRRKNVLLHIVVIEPENRVLVSHRPGYCMSVKTDNTEDIIRRFKSLDNNLYDVVLLRRQNNKVVG